MPRFEFEFLFGQAKRNQVGLILDIISWCRERTFNYLIMLCLNTLLREFFFSVFDGSKFETVIKSCGGMNEIPPRLTKGRMFESR